MALLQFGSLGLIATAPVTLPGGGFLPVLGEVLGPGLILVLCIVAGIGTFMLLPSRREGATRKIGGAVLLLTLLVLGATLFRYAAGASVTDGVSPYFWIFAAIALICAVRVITHPRPVYSALYFVLTVFATSGLFILLAAEFMAAALVLIYAGAILVTYVFVIMLAQQSQTASSRPLAGLADYDAVSREPILACIAGFMLMGMLLFVVFDRGQQLTAVPEASAPGARGLGESLFGPNLVSTETAGVILTLAMVGAITIARRRIPSAATSAGALHDTQAEPTAVDDNPHSIPVYGTENPRQKAYPET